MVIDTLYGRNHGCIKNLFKTKMIIFVRSTSMIMNPINHQNSAVFECNAMSVEEPVA